MVSVSSGSCRMVFMITRTESVMMNDGLTRHSMRQHLDRGCRGLSRTYTRGKAARIRCLVMWTLAQRRELVDLGFPLKKRPILVLAAHADEDADVLDRERAGRPRCRNIYRKVSRTNADHTHHGTCKRRCCWGIISKSRAAGLS